MDNLNELLSSPCLEALSALHSANFMPRRLRQPDRIDNLSTDSFNPHCPSSLPPGRSLLRPSPECDLTKANAAGKGKWE